ncbi:hypothetical protein BISA_0858 [Bifidobacterium saguini DSM 23967]|uniref:Uncharacterized protein n=2 Tax=Bifidobacterium saguini TaxID=762210 RepID=A0A087DAA8_9BIFI|nr:hypothetical protein [Bifidobacterium saguini]KFI92458.1 hypothetical protein BISA_0858 [Bifidobacterium saguini DSM 23967]QTB90817.1 hypothetical protein BSD967_11120 [Bifidobacterium saguini]QTB90879.1 hypothetical protein BSD967_11455 [Bifidobacterium saguini]
MSTVFPTPRERSIRALTELDADLNTLSRPEAFILGYETAWQASRRLTEDIVTAINDLEPAETEETE